jgi:hypothetical protein
MMRPRRRSLDPGQWHLIITLAMFAGAVITFILIVVPWTPIGWRIFCVVMFLSFTTALRATWRIW